MIFAGFGSNFHFGQARDAPPIVTGTIGDAALGLLVMTVVIEVFVYPEAYPVHGPWAVCCLVVMVHGAGVFSLDHLIVKRAAEQDRRPSP